MYRSYKKVEAANKADDAQDEDGNGIADVKEMPSNELVARKLRMAARAVDDPHQLTAALGGLWTGWLAVQGVLRIQFARTISVAVSCSQFVEYYLLKLLLPILTPLTAHDFVHWLPTVLTGATKAIFVYLAWKAQEVVSAVQSALRGGLMFSRGLLSHLNKRGVKSIFGFSLQDEHTYVDEIFGYTVALFGVWVQFQWGFGVPFPLNLVMWPFDVLEWYIRWSVTSGMEQA